MGSTRATGRSCGRRRAAARVAGFDLTFSAPKSVSVLFGLGDDELRGRVRAAHDVAVREAVGYLERSAAAVRRGHAGAIVEEASGLVAAAFRHRTSRAGDPQLHTHVLVANLGRGIDGRWSALDGRRLYAEARAASFIYQAVLRGELTRDGRRRVGAGAARDRRGRRCPADRDAGVQSAAGGDRCGARRARDVRGAGGGGGGVGDAAGEGPARDRGAARRGSGARGRRSSGSGERELGPVGRAARRRSVVETRIGGGDASELAGPDGLTRSSATFGRGEVLQALCEALPRGASVDAHDAGGAPRRFLEERAVALVPDGEARATGETFRRRDGRLMPAGADRLRYSTPEHLALERRARRASASPRAALARVVATLPSSRRCVAARPTLSRRAAAGGRGACASTGTASRSSPGGPGRARRSRSARRARRGRRPGYPVLGVAVARRAAGELTEGAGIESTSVAALLGELEAGGELPDALRAGRRRGRDGLDAAARGAARSRRARVQGSSCWSATIGSCRRSRPAGRSAG